MPSSCTYSTWHSTPRCSACVHVFVCVCACTRFGRLRGMRFLFAVLERLTLANADTAEALEIFGKAQRVVAQAFSRRFVAARRVTAVRCVVQCVVWVCGVGGWVGVCLSVCVLAVSLPCVWVCGCGCLGVWVSGCSCGCVSPHFGVRLAEVPSTHACTRRPSWWLPPSRPRDAAEWPQSARYRSRSGGRRVP